MVVVVNVVVVVAALVGTGVVVVTRLKSAIGSAGYNRGVTPVSCSLSEACNFAIAVHARSGNGLDRVCAQFNSIRVSCMSIFLAVFMFSSVGANTAEFVCAGVVLVAALTARCSSCLRMFSAAFRQMLSIYWSTGNHNKKIINGLTVVDISRVLVLE